MDKGSQYGLALSGASTATQGYENSGNLSQEGNVAGGMKLPRWFWYAAISVVGLALVIFIVRKF